MSELTEALGPVRDIVATTLRVVPSVRVGCYQRRRRGKNVLEVIVPLEDYKRLGWDETTRFALTTRTPGTVWMLKDWAQEGTQRSLRSGGKAFEIRFTIESTPPFAAMDAAVVRDHASGSYMLTVREEDKKPVQSRTPIKKSPLATPSDWAATLETASKVDDETIRACLTQLRHIEATTPFRLVRIKKDEVDHWVFRHSIE